MTHCCNRRTAGSWNVKGGSPQRACLCLCVRPTLLHSAAYSSAPACSGLNGARGKWSARSSRTWILHRKFIDTPHYPWSTGRDRRCIPCSCIHRSCRSPHIALCTPGRQWNTHSRPPQSALPPGQTSRHCSISSQAGIRPEDTVDKGLHLNVSGRPQWMPIRKRLFLQIPSSSLLVCFFVSYESKTKSRGFNNKRKLKIMWTVKGCDGFYYSQNVLIEFHRFCIRTIKLFKHVKVLFYKL